MTRDAIENFQKSEMPVGSAIIHELDFSTLPYNYGRSDSGIKLNDAKIVSGNNGLESIDFGPMDTDEIYGNAIAAVAPELRDDVRMSVRRMTLALINANNPITKSADGTESFVLNQPGSKAIDAAEFEMVKNAWQQLSPAMVAEMKATITGLHDFMEFPSVLDSWESQFFPAFEVKERERRAVNEQTFKMFSHAS